MDTARLSIAASVMLGLSLGSALAAPELVTNGNFEQTSLTSSTQFTGSALTGWTNTATGGATGYAYNFLALPGTADTTGFTTTGGVRNRLVGPDGSVLNLNYSANGLPDNSPAGGNYLISSTGTSNGGAVSQIISGLTAGQSYDLSFYWAAAQFAGTLVATSEYWNVTFGSATQSTAVVTQGIGGYSPWTRSAMTFVASGTTQTLSFLAVGTPNGVPSAGLLDGVSLTSAPEPASWALFAAGLLGLIGAARWRAGASLVTGGAGNSRVFCRPRRRETILAKLRRP